MSTLEVFKYSVTVQCVPQEIAVQDCDPKHEWNRKCFCCFRLFMKRVMFSSHTTTKGQISHSFSDLFLKNFCFISHVAPRKQVEQRSGAVCENVNSLFPAWVTDPLRGLQTDVQTCSYLSGFAV